MKPIWIIDDDKSIRWVFEKALARTDLEFKTFSSVAEALNALEREQPQVVVSDIRMPNGSGLDFLGEIKQKYDFLFEQSADLESAIITLESVIKDLDKEIKIRFLSSIGLIYFFAYDKTSSGISESSATLFDREPTGPNFIAQYISPTIGRPYFRK